MSVARDARMLEAVANQRPQPIQRETFETFLIAEGSLSGVGRAHPRGSFDTLDQAIEAGSVSHKGKFVVRHTDTLTGQAMLKFYVVKRKSRPEYRHHDYQTRAVHDLYAEHLLDLRGDAL